MKHTKLILTAIIGLSLISCGRDKTPVPAPMKEQVVSGGKTEIHFVFDDGGDFSEMVETKSGYAPSETSINDVNVFIYGSDGKLYEKLFGTGTDAHNLHPTVLVNQTYKFFVLCNYGSALTPPETVSSVPALVYTFANASLGAHGIPMAGTYEKKIVKDDIITVEVKRLVAKIGLKFDRSDLSLSEYNVTAVRLKGAPTHIRPWTEGYSDSAMQDGDFATSDDLAYLNGGGEVYFYVPENCAGTKTGITASKDKVDSNAPNEGNVPYLEVESTYRNHGLDSDNAKFRFYIGINNTSDFNVYRNYIYHYTLKPSDDSILDPYFKIDAGDISSSRSLSWAPTSLSMLYDQTKTSVLTVVPDDLPYTITASGAWTGNATWSQSERTFSVHALYTETAGVNMSLTAEAGVPGKAGYVSSTLPVSIKNTRVTDYEEPVIYFGIGNDISPSGDTAFTPDVTGLKVTQRSRIIYNGAPGAWSDPADVTASATIEYGKDGSSYISARPTYSASDLGTTGTSRTERGRLYVKATVNGKSSTKDLPVYQAANNLESVTIAPASVTLNYGSAQAYTASATFTTGQSKGVTASFVSSNTGVATMSGATATVVGVSGTTTITGSYSENGISKSGTATLTAKNEVKSTYYEYEAPTFTLGNVSDIACGGGTSSAPSVTGINHRRRLHSVYYNGADTAGSWENCGDAVTIEYSKDGSNWATVHTGYTASSLGTTGKSRTKQGTIYVRVSAHGLSTTKSVDVYQGANNLESITITPASATLNYGSTQVYTATAKFTTTNTKTVTATYTSSNTGVATISGATATVVGVSGTTTITGSYSENGISKSGTATLGAKNEVKSTYYEYEAPTFTLGSVGDVAASGGTSSAPSVTSINHRRRLHSVYYNGTDSPGSWENCTDGVTTEYSQNNSSWSTTHTGHTGSNLGTTGKSRTKLGTIYVRVSAHSKSTTKSVDVYQAANNLESITIAPASVTLNYGSTQAYTASAKFTTGQSKGVTATYTSSNTGVATMSGATATVVGTSGSTTITGSYSENGISKSGTATLGAKNEVKSTYYEYEAPTFTLGSVGDVAAGGGTSSAPSVTSINHRRRLHSVYYNGTDSPGSWENCTDGVTTEYSQNNSSWSTTHTGHTGSNLGTTGKSRTKLGTIYVRVSAHSKSTTKSVDVYQAANNLESVTIAPASVTLNYGSTQTYTASAKFTTGQSKGVTASYTSSNTGVATMSGATATVVGTSGSTTITGSYSENGISKSGTATLTAKNDVKSTYYEYEAPSFTLGSIADIPASGGTSSAPSVTGISHRRRLHSVYYNGTDTAGSWENCGDATTTEYQKDGGSWSTSHSGVTVSSLGTTVRARTKVGTISVRVSAHGKSTTKSVDVYQQANEKSTQSYPYNQRTQNCYQSYTEYKVDGFASKGDIPASGGSSAGQGTGYSRTNYKGSSYTKYDYYYTYTSGSTSFHYSNTASGWTDGNTPGAGSWGGATTVTGSTVSANSLGTTVKSRTKIGDSTTNWNGVNCSAEIFQQANAASGPNAENERTQACYQAYTEYKVDGFASKGDIPASGGSSYGQGTGYSRTNYRSSSYTKYDYYYSYTSGSKSFSHSNTASGWTDGSAPGAGSWGGATTVTGSTVSANSLGTTTKSRTSVGNSTTTWNGVPCSVAIYQAANQVTNTEYMSPEVSISASSTTVEASGGTVTLTYSASYLTRDQYTSGNYTSWSTKSGTPTISGSATGFTRNGETVTIAANKGVVRSVSYTATFSIGGLSADRKSVTISQKAAGGFVPFNVNTIVIMRTANPQNYLSTNCTISIECGEINYSRKIMLAYNLTSQLSKDWYNSFMYLSDTEPHITSQFESMTISGMSWQNTNPVLIEVYVGKVLPMSYQEIIDDKDKLVGSIIVNNTSTAVIPINYLGVSLSGTTTPKGIIIVVFKSPAN